MAVESRAARSSAPALIAVLLTLPGELHITGRPTPLAETIASATQPQQQLEAVRSYWKLSSVLALYRVAWDEYQAWASIRDSAAARRLSAADLLAAQTRRAQAAAQLEQAAEQLLVAQEELVQRLHLPTGAPLPLPADKPHVGTYNTRYEQIYRSATLATEAQFNHRTLEPRRLLVERRAAAEQAAEDVFEAEMERFNAGNLDFRSLATALDAWNRQRRAFVAVVAQYNNQIAEYALQVPRGNQPLAADSLAGMLVRSPAKWSPPAAPTGVVPATYNQEIPSAPALIRLPPPPELATGPQPTLAKPRRGLGPNSAGPNRAAPTGAAVSINGANATSDDDEPPALLPKDVVPGAEPMAPSLVPGAQFFGPQQVNRQPLPAVAGGSSAAVDVGLYSALVDAAPAKRAQELSNLLSWNRHLSADAGSPVTLEQCVQAVPKGAQRLVIAACWHTRQAMAEYQAVFQELEQVDAAAAAMLKNRQHPDSAEGMLRVRAARLDLEAVQLEAQLALLAEQFKLTQMMFGPADKPWVLPSTPPHGGGYLLKADAQPQAQTDSFSFKRSTVVVPALHQTLEQQAEAVVLADAERVLVAGAVEAGSENVERLLAAIDRQARETRAFLATLTRYNTEIGDYAVSVLGFQASPQMLVRALVTPAALAEKL